MILWRLNFAWPLSSVLTLTSCWRCNFLLCLLQPTAVCRSLAWISALQAQEVQVRCFWSSSSESSSSEEVWPGSGVPEDSASSGLRGSVTSRLAWESRRSITQAWASLALLTRLASLFYTHCLISSIPFFPFPPSLFPRDSGNRECNNNSKSPKYWV